MNEPNLDEICEFNLSILSYLWRSLSGMDEARAVVERIFRKDTEYASQRGWKGVRRMDDELPTEHLPFAPIEETSRGKERAASVREYQMSNLAAIWRGFVADPDAQAIVARIYNEVLEAMRERGWRASLDLDAELPDSLLPKWYLDQS